MSQKKANPYLESMVMTASPEQLHLMLFDGALRFIDAALAESESKDLESYFTNVTKARKIVAELVSSLKPDVAPELCSKLAGLYVFVYQKLVTAGVKREVEDLKDARHVLAIQRETWAELCKKLQDEKQAGATQGAGAQRADGNPKPAGNSDTRISIAV